MSRQGSVAGSVRSKDSMRGSASGNVPPAGQGSVYGAAPSMDVNGPRCAVCRGLMSDKDDNDQAQVEKSTRIVLGLLAHYSDTLMSVLRKNPQKKKAMEDEEASSVSCMCVMLVTVLLLVFGSLATTIFVATKKSASSAAAAASLVQMPTAPRGSTA